MIFDRIQKGERRASWKDVENWSAKYNQKNMDWFQGGLEETYHKKIGKHLFTSLISHATLALEINESTYR